MAAFKVLYRVKISLGGYEISGVIDLNNWTRDGT